MSAQIDQKNRNNVLQQQLYTWFQSRGLISKLVSFLRTQMVLELKSNLVDLKTTNAKGQHFASPKLQAIKLLVADFLLQNEFFFTLSVFSTEVPSLCNIPEFVSYVSDIASTCNISTATTKPKPKFNIDDVKDIFEALGLKLSMEEITVMYEIYTSNEQSLIMSIFQLVHKMSENFWKQEAALRTKTKKEISYKNVMNKERKKWKEIRLKLEQAHIIAIKDKIQQDEQEKKEHTQLNALTVQLKDVKNELLEAENKLRIKDEKINSMLVEIGQMELQLQQKTKENEELLLKFNRLKNDYDDLGKESNNDEEYNLKVALKTYESKFMNLQQEMFDIRNKLKNSPNISKNSIDNVQQCCKYIQCDLKCDQQLPLEKPDHNQELTMLKKYLENFEEENLELRRGQRKRQRRIEELTLEVNELRNELHWTRSELRINRELLSMKKGETKPKEKPATFEPESNSKESSSLTDERLVTDTENKIQQLEKQHDSINRNLWNLQAVIERNVNLHSASSSPRNRMVSSRSSEYGLRYGDSFSGDVDTSSDTSSPLRYRNTEERSFRQMFLKNKQRAQAAWNLDRRGADTITPPSSKLTEAKSSSYRRNLLKDYTETLGDKKEFRSKFDLELLQELETKPLEKEVKLTAGMNLEQQEEPNLIAGEEKQNLELQREICDQEENILLPIEPKTNVDRSSGGSTNLSLSVPSASSSDFWK